MTDPFCIDCKHCQSHTRVVEVGPGRFEVTINQYLCKHPKSSFEPHPSYRVDGVVEHARCQDLRNEYQCSETDCGPEGQYFEAKSPPR